MDDYNQYLVRYTQAASGLGIEFAHGGDTDLEAWKWPAAIACRDAKRGRVLTRAQFDEAYRRFKTADSQGNSAYQSYLRDFIEASSGYGIDPQGRHAEDARARLTLAVNCGFAARGELLTPDQWRASLKEELSDHPATDTGRFRRVDAPV